ncbi:hypothetical protein BJ742DRAFT_106903 [Cladochytrium replicatum]|nr:hypothetical protein BJ742DRAFT_106903 [Cladochytrium replicatum]
MMGRKYTLQLHNPDETTYSDAETSSSASTAVSPPTPIAHSSSRNHRSLGRPGTFGQRTTTQFQRRLSDPASSLSNTPQRPPLLPNQFEQPSPPRQQQQQTDSSGVPISAYGLAPVPFKVWLQDRKGRLDKIKKQSSNLDTLHDDSGSNFDSNYEDEAEVTVPTTPVNTSTNGGLPSPVSPRKENVNPRFYELPGATVAGIPPYPSLTKRPSNISGTSSSEDDDRDHRRNSRQTTSTPSSTRSFSVPPPTPPVRSASRKRDMQNEAKVVRFATFGRGEGREARERIKEREEERRGKVVLNKDEFVELIRALRDDTRVLSGEQRDAAPARKESLKRTKDKDAVAFFD